MEHLGAAPFTIVVSRVDVIVSTTTLASGQNYPGSIAVDATSVYWTNYLGGTVMKLTPK